MKFGDKLKGIRDQAQQAVTEHKDQIQNAVQDLGQVANAKTHGKYADKIERFGEKATSTVDKFGHGDSADASADASAGPTADATAAPVADAPEPAAAAPAPSGEPPAFE